MPSDFEDTHQDIATILMSVLNLGPLRPIHLSQMVPIQIIPPRRDLCEQNWPQKVVGVLKLGSQTRSLSSSLEFNFEQHKNFFYGSLYRFNIPER